MLAELRVELEQMAKAGRSRALVPHRGKGNLIEVRGKTVVDFASWDLFGLANHPKVKREAQTVIERRGIGMSSPRAMSGTTDEHSSLETRLSVFFGYESTALFSSRNQAVLSLITSIAGEQDVVIVDEVLQSPAADAAFLVHANVTTISPGQLDRLSQELERNAQARRKIVVLESLSPITGKLLDVAGALAMAQKYDAYVVLDESYALGIAGLRGAGGSEALALQTPHLSAFGDTSFLLGTYGAFFSGPAVLVDYVINRSRTFTNDPPLPPALAAATEESLNVIELSVALRERLTALVRKLRQGLLSLGFIGVESASTPVVCLEFKRLSDAVEMSAALFQKGFLVESVPRGTLLSESAVVRILVSCAHTEKQVEDLLQATSEIVSKLKI